MFPSLQSSSSFLFLLMICLQPFHRLCVSDTLCPYIDLVIYTTFILIFSHTSFASSEIRNRSFINYCPRAEIISKLITRYDSLQQVRFYCLSYFRNKSASFHIWIHCFTKLKLQSQHMIPKHNLLGSDTGSLSPRFHERD